MKTFACVVLLVAVAVAEPPQYRQSFFRFQRQEIAEPDSGKQNPTQAEEAPYPPAGFRPTKEFNLPSRQELAPPSTSYGIPDDSYAAPISTYTVPQVPVLYGVPQVQYGVPEQKEEGTEEKKDDESVVTESELKAENKDGEANKEREDLKEEPKKDVEVVSNQGVYYVLLPGSQLQRVQFQTENDIRNMAYTARLQYSNEGRAPVYVYTAVPQYQSAAYVQLF